MNDFKKVEADFHSPEIENLEMELDDYYSQMSFEEQRAQYKALKFLEEENEKRLQEIPPENVEMETALMIDEIEHLMKPNKKVKEDKFLNYKDLKKLPELRVIPYIKQLNEFMFEQIKEIEKKYTPFERHVELMNEVNRLQMNFQKVPNWSGEIEKIKKQIPPDLSQEIKNLKKQIPPDFSFEIEELQNKKSIDYSLDIQELKNKTHDINLEMQSLTNILTNTIKHTNETTKFQIKNDINDIEERLDILEKKPFITIENVEEKIKELIPQITPSTNIDEKLKENYDTLQCKIIFYKQMLDKRIENDVNEIKERLDSIEKTPQITPTTNTEEMTEKKSKSLEHRIKIMNTQWKENFEKLQAQIEELNKKEHQQDIDIKATTDLFVTSLKNARQSMTNEFKYSISELEERLYAIEDKIKPAQPKPAPKEDDW